MKVANFQRLVYPGHRSCSVQPCLHPGTETNELSSKVKNCKSDDSDLDISDGNFEINTNMYDLWIIYKCAPMILKIRAL